jgi:hypothetical protein
MKYTVEYARASVETHEVAQEIIEANSDAQGRAERYLSHHAKAESAAKALFYAAVNDKPLSDWSLLSRLAPFRHEIAYVALNRIQYDQQIAAIPEDQKDFAEKQQNAQQKILTAPETLSGRFNLKSAGLFALGEDEPFMQAFEAGHPDIAQRFQDMLAMFKDAPTWDELSNEGKISLLQLNVLKDPQPALKNYETFMQDCHSHIDTLMAPENRIAAIQVGLAGRMETIFEKVCAEFRL